MPPDGPRHLRQVGRRRIHIEDRDRHDLVGPGERAGVAERRLSVAVRADHLHQRIGAADEERNRRALGLADVAQRRDKDSWRALGGVGRYVCRGQIQRWGGIRRDKRAWSSARSELEDGVARAGIEAAIRTNRSRRDRAVGQYRCGKGIRGDVHKLERIVAMDQQRFRRSITLHLAHRDPEVRADTRQRRHHGR